MWKIYHETQKTYCVEYCSYKKIGQTETLYCHSNEELQKIMNMLSDDTDVFSLTIWERVDIDWEAE